MRYPGGKGKCFQRLINLMPPHETYIESHLGGGTIMRHKRPAPRNIGIDIDPRAIALCRRSGMPAAELLNQDAVPFLRRFEYTGSELVYSDPPYIPSTRKQARVYRFDYSEGDHVTLLETLRSLPCMVMVSGYDNELYRTMLTGWRHITFSAKSHVGLRVESVWMNYAEPKMLHDARYFGRGFRERQTYQRRQARLRERVCAMSPVERAEFSRWLDESFPRKAREG